MMGMIIITSDPTVTTEVTWVRGHRRERGGGGGGVTANYHPIAARRFSCLRDTSRATPLTNNKDEVNRLSREARGEEIQEDAQEENCSDKETSQQFPGPCSSVHLHTTELQNPPVKPVREQVLRFPGGF